MRLANQYVSHVQVVPTFVCGILTFFFLFVVFLAFGLICYFKSNKLNDFTVRYDDICKDLPVCTIIVPVPSSLTNPNIYYMIDNFYHNHRYFVKSRSFSQLAGKASSVNINNCSPIKTISDLGDMPEVLANPSLKSD